MAASTHSQPSTGEVPGTLPRASAEQQGLADSVSDACARLGISAPTFYREVRAGRLEARKAGRRTLCTREAQAAWLAALPKA